jgi:hypothetical protein
VTFKASYESRALLGLLNMSCYSRTFSATDTSAVIDVTTLCKKAKEFIPGQTSATASLDGPLDTDTTATNNFFAATAAMKQASTPFTYAPEGLSAGSPLLMGLALQTGITTQSTVAGGVDWSMSLDLDGPLDAGAAIETESTITIDTSGAAQNNGAATANGGVAHLHVSDFTGLSSDVITIEHSVNGSTSWATLVTFSTVAGKTSERVVVAPGTTVRQYLRVVDDVTGTGSITRFVGFARR